MTAIRTSAYTIKINPKEMAPGRLYLFDFGNDSFVALKEPDGKIVIYEVVRPSDSTTEREGA